MTASEPGLTRGRRSFGPVVLAGLACAGLCAVAAGRPWFDDGRELAGSALPGVTVQTGQSYPAASALSLVLLAAWGVLLVTRGRVRRGFAAVAALAAVGLVVSVVAAGLDPPDLGEGTSLTGWFWTAAVLAPLAVVPGVLAVRLAPGWPEMGSRYDAPTAEGGAARPRGEPAGEQELWKQLDAGHDPTQEPS